MTAGRRPPKPTGERFADLVDGETRPLEPGPPRIAPPSRAPGVGRAGRAARAERDPAAGEPGERAGRLRWPDPEERLRAAAPGVSHARLAALGRGEPPPEERIDLHGVRRDAGARLLARRLESARERGLRCVLLIHGRGRGSATGEAVLREALPGWLSRAPTVDHVLAFAPAPPRLGGAGATLVLLRRPMRDAGAR